MITVWGRTTSSNVQAALWALAEIEIDYERIDAGGAFGMVDTPEFKAMNPNSLVPVLRDGDMIIWESAAIVRYLGARYGSETFWPSDPARRAPLDMWAEWAKTTLVPALIGGLFFPLVRTREADRDPALVRSNAEKLKPIARMLDARLSVDTFLGGEEPCFADIMVATPLYRYFTLDFDRADTPALSAHYERLTQRPRYAEHVMVSYESLRVR